MDPRWWWKYLVQFVQITTRICSPTSICFWELLFVHIVYIFPPHLQDFCTRRRGRWSIFLPSPIKTYDYNSVLHENDSCYLCPLVRHGYHRWRHDGSIQVCWWRHLLQRWRFCQPISSSSGRGLICYHYALFHCPTSGPFSRQVLRGDRVERCGPSNHCSHGRTPHVGLHF